MSHRNRWRSCLRAALLFGTFVAGASPALAQQVRVKSGPIEVFQWRNSKEKVGTVDAGAILQIIERDGDWMWIVLPADVFGTRRVGWVRIDEVEPTALKEGMPVLQLAPEPPMPGQVPPRAGRMRNRLAGPPTRWQIEGLGGTTFGTETAGFFGGALAVELTPLLQLSIEAGHFDDIVSPEIEDLSAALAGRAEQFFLGVTGRTVDVIPQTEVPAHYGMLGVRALLPTGGRTRPYVSGGVGFASVRPGVRLLLGGDDVTATFVGAGEVPEDRTRMMLSMGGGVNVMLVRGVVLDLGYRFARVYFEDGINVNRAFVGLGYTF